MALYAQKSVQINRKFIFEKKTCDINTVVENKFQDIFQNYLPETSIVHIKNKERKNILRKKNSSRVV